MSFDIKSTLLGVVAGLFIIAVATVATGTRGWAQTALYSQPYSFPATNRGNTAVIMKQVESGLLDGSNATGSSQSAGGSPIMICGGSSGGSSPNTASSSTANSSCIILNNSTGAITLGQDSDGSQSSSAESSIDQVNEILDGSANP